MYTINSRVRYSETDSKGYLSLEGIVNYFQDCSTFHSEDVGAGLAFLASQERAWLLASWQIVIDSYPKMGQNIKIMTNPYGHDRFFAFRNFAICDENAHIMVKANSVWIYVDVAKNRPVRITEDEIKPFYIFGKSQERLDMDYAPRKFIAPKDGLQRDPIVVMSHHLDTNKHVNNGQYIHFACEYLPPGTIIKEIRAEYKIAAKLGDVILPKVTTINKGCIVTLEEENGGLYAAVELFTD